MLGTRRSDDGGRFHFDSAATIGATGLVARRIGFRPSSLSRQDRRDDVRPEMEEIAVPRLGDSARIAELGYACEYKMATARPTRLHKLDRGWRYAKLHSSVAQHSLDRSFGDGHTFSLGRTSARHEAT